MFLSRFCFGFFCLIFSHHFHLDANFPKKKKKQKEEKKVLHFSIIVHFVFQVSHDSGWPLCAMYFDSPLNAFVCFTNWFPMHDPKLVD